VRDAEKARVVEIARDLERLGFSLMATKGTAATLRAHGLDCETIHKVAEGRPHIVDLIKNDQIALIVNTTEGKQAIADSFSIRREALMRKVSYTTTLAAARATCQALRELDNGTVNCLQDLHRELHA
jgi:carbamoyl-phosphate synthase large subunit